MGFCRCHHLISVADAMTDLMVEAGVAPREKFTTIYSGMNVEPFTRAKEHRAAVRNKYGFEDEHVVIGKIARCFISRASGSDQGCSPGGEDANPTFGFCSLGMEYSGSH